MDYNYNDVLKYIVDSFEYMDEEIDLALTNMNRYKLPLSHAGSKVEDAIIDAIHDYEFDNDFEEDAILDDILDNTDIEDVLYDALEYKKNNINEAFYNKNKRNPYDDKKNPKEYETQPLKSNVSLYDVRQRVQEIIMNCNKDDVDIAKKQALRLYKLVDALINQCY